MLDVKVQNITEDSYELEEVKNNSEPDINQLSFEGKDDPKKGYIEEDRSDEAGAASIDTNLNDMVNKVTHLDTNEDSSFISMDEQALTNATDIIRSEEPHLFDGTDHCIAYGPSVEDYRNWHEVIHQI